MIDYPPSPDGGAARAIPLEQTLKDRLAEFRRGVWLRLCDARDARDVGQAAMLGQMDAELREMLALSPCAPPSPGAEETLTPLTLLTDDLASYPPSEREARLATLIGKAYDRGYVDGQASLSCATGAPPTIRHRSGCTAWATDHPQEWRSGDEKLCNCGAAQFMAPCATGEERPLEPSGVAGITTDTVRAVLQSALADVKVSWNWTDDDTPEEQFFESLIDRIGCALGFLDIIEGRTTTLAEIDAERLERAGLARPEEPKREDVFVPCVWSCSKCNRAGTVSVWPYSHETREQTATRHGRETQQRCVAGCLYLARPEDQPQQEHESRSPDGDGQSLVERAVSGEGQAHGTPISPQAGDRRSTVQSDQQTTDARLDVAGELETVSAGGRAGREQGEPQLRRPRPEGAGSEPADSHHQSAGEVAARPRLEALIEKWCDWASSDFAKASARDYHEIDQIIYAASGRAKRACADELRALLTGKDHP